MSELEEKINEFQIQSIKVLIPKSISYEFNNESKSVGGGESINLPRNEAYFLVKEHQCVVQYSDVMAELKQTLSKEKMVGEFELSRIDDFFYMRLNEYLDTLSGSQKESFMDLMNELFRMRNGKIIKFASTSLNLLDDLSKRLSIEEKIFLKEIASLSHALKSKIFPNPQDIK